MTDEKIISMFKSMTDETDSGTLSTYLFLAKQIILNRAFPLGWDVDAVPECYIANQLRIALYLLNKRGAEGEISHTENGVSRTYSSADIPYSLLRDILPVVKVIGGREREVNGNQ